MVKKASDKKTLKSLVLMFGDQFAWIFVILKKQGKWVLFIWFR
jgi:hypothetical protein